LEVFKKLNQQSFIIAILSFKLKIQKYLEDEKIHSCPKKFQLALMILMIGLKKTNF